MIGFSDITGQKHIDGSRKNSQRKIYSITGPCGPELIWYLGK